MCTGLEIAAIAATVGGTVMGQQQQQKSMRRYNNEVSAQNKLLSDQFSDRQQKISAAKDSQAKVFQDMATAQDEEFAKQTQLANEKAQKFRDAANNPLVSQAAQPNFAESVDKRNQLFRDTAQSVTPDFGANQQTGTENRVLRTAAEKQLSDKSAETTGIADAYARMAGLQDVQQQQGDLFRNLGVNLGDTAKDANASSRLLSAKLRLPEYRMSALNSAIGEQAGQPYFRGEEPVYRTPNTLFSDLLTGAGQLGMTTSFMKPGSAAGAMSGSTSATVPLGPSKLFA